MGITWSQYHISHIGRPLCGTLVPDRVQRSVDRPAQIRDWPHLCAKCRTLAQRAATAENSTDSCPACGGYVRGPDGRCVDCFAAWPIRETPTLTPR